MAACWTNWRTEKIHTKMIRKDKSVSHASTKWGLQETWPVECLTSPAKRWLKMKQRIPSLSIDRPTYLSLISLHYHSEFISQCVHRDLAARNVLLGDRNVAMVSDFGMSRDVYESGEYETLCRVWLFPLFVRMTGREGLCNFKVTLYWFKMFPFPPPPKIIIVFGQCRQNLQPCNYKCLWCSSINWSAS